MTTAGGLPLMFIEERWHTVTTREKGYTVITVTTRERGYNVITGEGRLLWLVRKWERTCRTSCTTRVRGYTALTTGGALF